MRVFVTGGNGFIGSLVVQELVARGDTVVCLLRATSDVSRLGGLTYERVDGDVRDRASLARGVASVDAVIHLASLSSWDLFDSPEMRDVVLTGTRNVLDAARDTGRLLRIVYVSSLTAIGATTVAQPLDETHVYNLGSVRGLTYSHCKHEAERLCAEAVAAGQSVTIVNPGEVYGPHDTGLITAGNLIDFIKSDPVLVCNGGTCVAHVEDVARATVAALDKGRSGERYILGGPNVTLRELAAETLAIAGVTATIRVLPNAVIRGVTAVATTLRIRLPYNAKVIPYATRYFFADTGKAQRELGVTFRSLRETLAPTVAWLYDAGKLEVAKPS